MGKSSRNQEYSSDSDDSSEEERHKKQKKHKKKSKKSKHKSKKKRKNYSSSSNSDSSGEDEWVIKNIEEKSKKKDECFSEDPKVRDDWMTSENFFLPTFSREKPEKKTAAEKANHQIYDPATNSRELNPYFKTGEGGLPSFQKPKDDDDYLTNIKTAKSYSSSSSKQNWKKITETETRERRKSQSRSRSKSPISIQKPKELSPKDEMIHSDFLTDEQMNSLGAKIIKAEMMGKMKLAGELTAKLERAKEYKKNMKEKKPQHARVDNKQLLTLSTASGMSRPIKQDNNRGDNQSGRKNKAKRVETHEGGERTKFYPDDDRFDIKTLFEREKYSDGRDQDIEFAKAISKVKESQQMDMADIFSDTIRKDKVKKSDERDEAIREAQKMEKVLDSCFKCFDSPKMNKDLIVHVGKTIYLAIPYYEGLVNHHMVISTIQHVSCLTMIDEEVWEEFKNLKRALSQFFFAQNEDVVFFETVKYLNRRPHMEVQVISSKNFEMIQFYFKKAIQESEKATMNKKLIEIKSDKNIRSSVPRGLPYFWIDFGNSGMAHVIENQEEFPSNFAQEIIGGMLSLDVNRWRKPRKEQRPHKRIQYLSNLLKNTLENL